MSPTVVYFFLLFGVSCSLHRSSIYQVRQTRPVTDLLILTTRFSNSVPLFLVARRR
eukprot:m.27858 g.27858  ORF g.27858 m.27858 type:complete len:56 (+) comp30406_c0_seq2:80-247(+)